MKKDAVDFDDFAKDYREIHTENVHGISGADSSYFGAYQVRIVNEDFSERGGVIKILDLGCGDGMNASFFQQYFGRIEYYGIDVSRESIEQAKRYESADIHFQCYDGRKIPYKNNFFDIIFIACVLHHVPHDEHRNLLSECRRALKKSGGLYIFEHNPVNPVTRKIVRDCVFDEDAVLVHQGKLRKVLKQAGFPNVKAFYTIFFPRKGIFNKIIWMEKLLRWLPLGGQYYVICKK